MGRAVGANGLQHLMPRMRSPRAIVVHRSPLVPPGSRTYK